MSNTIPIQPGRGNPGFAERPAYAPNEATAFDIETLPLDDAVESFVYVQPKNIKKDEIVAADRAKKKAQFIEEAALLPITGRIVAIGYHGHGIEGTRIDIASSPGQERDIIAAFFNLYSGLGTKIAGYDCIRFDLQFIMARARKLRIAERKLLDIADLKPWTEKVIDVFIKHTGGGSQKSTLFPAPYGRLEHMASYYEVRSEYRKNECSSKQCGKYFVSGNEDMVAQARHHLIADVEETYALYKCL